MRVTLSFFQIIDLLNNAMYTSDGTEKVINLRKVQELVLHNDLLDNFLDEMLGFQSDRDIEVRRFVVGFVENACKKDSEYFPKVIVNLNMMLADESSNVVKKAIQTANQLYKEFLKWISKVKVTDEVESTYEVWTQIKQHLFGLLDTADNDGIRTQAIKFMETIVICQTHRDQFSTGDEFNIDNMTSNNLVDVDMLEEEAKQVFEQLIIFHGTPHISSVNLMATMQTLTLIARHRSQLFFSKVVQALEALHANLPPTLAKSQVNSVRKQLKLQLLILLKHPIVLSAPPYQTQITQLLTDLGASQSEVNKCLNENKKRVKAEPKDIEVKRIKLEADDDEEDNEPPPLAPPKVTRNEANTAIDITAEDLIPRLNTISNVSDLVLVSMLALPDTMPDHFQASYTPVAAAGTASQIKHLARLLSSQLTAAGLGKGVEEMVSRMTNSSKRQLNSEKNTEQNQKIAIVIGKSIAQELEKQRHQQQHHQQRVRLQQSGKQLSGTVKLRQLNLAEITKPLTEETKNRMALDAINRILKEDKKVFFSTSQLENRVKILAMLSCEYHDSSNISSLIRNYAFEDIRNRSEIIFNTLYNEFVLAKQQNNDFSHYSRYLTQTLKDLMSKPELKDRDHFLARFYSECPLLTEEAIQLLRHFILNENLYALSVTTGITILKTLVEKKKKQSYSLLSVLFDLCLNDMADVRTQAIKTAKTLHEILDLDRRTVIEDFALKTLRFLLDPKPPESIDKENSGLWNDDSIKLCLSLYLSLLPTNHKLIHDLAVVYVGTSADTKRIILRVLEGPVKGMGMNSPELLLLVENCPKGAETLVTRIIHVLTDKQPPSAELVSRVRDLYHKRVPDVRFLIPVVNGLSKKEVISALPKLIKLNPVVVKEVFNRLLGAHGSS